MTLKIHHMALWSALALLIALASPALAQSGSTMPASTFGDVRYGAADPIHLGKEPKPLYQVDAYFRIKDLREIAARDRGLFIVPSETGQEPRSLGKPPKPMRVIDTPYRSKELREIGSREKEGILIPSKIWA